MRLEPEYWAALADIAKREGITLHQLCSEIDSGAGELSRTAATRLFAVLYLMRLPSPTAECADQLGEEPDPAVDLAPAVIERYVARSKMAWQQKRRSRVGSTNPV